MVLHKNNAFIPYVYLAPRKGPENPKILQTFEIILVARPKAADTIR
jgi:hypothetical protein